MNWRIIINHRENDIALFLNAEGKNILVGLFERISQIGDDILKDENTELEEI